MTSGAAAGGRAERAVLSVLLMTLSAAPSAPAAEERGAGTPLRMSVRESVREALRNSERLEIARREIDKARGQIEEARAIALPHVDASVSYQRLSGLGAIFPGGDPGLGDLFRLDSLYQADMSFTQVLYQGGLVRAGLRAARLSGRRAEVNHQFARTGVAYATRIAYANVLLKREFEDVAAESLALARRSLDDVRSRRDAGDATDFDCLQAGVRVRNVEAALFRSRTAARLAGARFMRVVGLDLGAEVELTDGLPDLVAGLVRDLGGSRKAADYLAMALGSGGGGHGRGARLDLRSAELTVRLQDVARSVSTAGRRPSLALQGTWTGNGLYGFFDEGFDFSWRWGLVLRVPLFDGMAARGRHTQALASLAQAESGRESLARDVELEVRSAFWRVENAREAVASASGGIKEAEEAVRQAVVRHRNGVITDFALEEARLGLARARTNLAEAEFELYGSVLDLQRAAGLLEVSAE